jgi:hypothetical protein
LPAVSSRGLCGGWRYASFFLSLVIAGSRAAWASHLVARASAGQSGRGEAAHTATRPQADGPVTSLRGATLPTLMLRLPRN